MRVIRSVSYSLETESRAAGEKGEVNACARECVYLGRFKRDGEGEEAPFKIETRPVRGEDATDDDASTGGFNVIAPGSNGVSPPSLPPPSLSPFMLLRTFSPLMWGRVAESPGWRSALAWSPLLGDGEYDRDKGRRYDSDCFSAGLEEWEDWGSRGADAAMAAWN